MLCPSLLSQVRFALRQSDHDASPKRLAQAATLLKAAAGLKVSDPQQQGRTNVLLGDGKYVEILPGVEVAEATHPGALQLLAEIYLASTQCRPMLSILKPNLSRHPHETPRPHGLQPSGCSVHLLLCSMVINMQH